tara:strand:+ start:3760 stop:5031 length:1272 start_codon:yes stop_codon:yes gene_type:complete
VVKQAVIIAGGKGTRLKSVLNQKPKILVNLDNKTLLDYQIDYLKSNGISSIHFCLGHGSDQVLAHLEKTNIKYTYSVEERPLGTYGALYNSREYLEDTFFVLYGDVLTNFNIQEGYNSFIHQDSDFHLILRYTNHPEDSDLVELGEDNRVLSISRIQNKNNSFMPIGNTSLLFSKKNSIKKTRNETPVDIFKDFLQNNLNTLHITGSISIDYIRDIGTKERYESEISNYKKKIGKPYKVVFLDRDGTLVEDQGNENNTEKLVFKNISLDILKYLQQENFKIILISNQPGIAKGFFELKDVNIFNSHIQHNLIEMDLLPLDDIFICVHHPESGFEGEVEKLKINCNCRKPKTGLVEAAIKNHNLDKNNFIFIGDTVRDYELSLKFDSQFYLIESDLTDIKYFDSKNIVPLSTSEEFIVEIEDKS